MNEAYLLNDVCELIVDCEHKTAPTQETGYPSIRTPNIGRGNLILDKVKRVSEETYTKWTKRAIPKTDDLILAREAPVGNVAIIPRNLKVCLGQRTVLIRPNKNKIHPHYLCYLLLGDEVQGKIFSLSNGATVHHLNMGDIRNLELPELPSLPVQNKIASIISAYDRLIENNTRRIKILETMAQTLYQEWFVKFRFPGCEQVKMVESELGLIPEGWEVTNFNSLISHHIGGGWGKDKVDKKYSVPAYVVRGTDIPSARYINTENCPLRFHTKSNFKSRKVEVGDLIFEVSGGSKGQPVGRTLLVSEALLDAFDEDLICASFCKLIRLNQSIILPEIIYLLILAMYDDGRIEKHQVQSTGISNFKFKPFLENEYVVIPPLQIQEKFGNLVIPLFELLHNLGAKNTNLRKTRDLLLPKLISGQIDVENLDIDTGELAA